MLCFYAEYIVFVAVVRLFQYSDSDCWLAIHGFYTNINTGLHVRRYLCYLKNKCRHIMFGVVLTRFYIRYLSSIIIV